MASAVCQNQFLGSRISLVSKSEIRYEGILYALDLCEATISLAKVRSFGTEDRPTDRPIPPKDEVFEYIIFRGPDIKLIDVVEPPKHAANASQQAGVPEDPAIVEYSHSGHSSGNGFHYEGRGRPNQNSIFDNLFKGGRGGPQQYNGPGGGQRRRSYEYQNDAGQGGRNRNMGGGQRQFGPGDGGRNHFEGNVFRQGGGGFRNNGGQFQGRGRMTTPNRGDNFGQPQRRGGRGGPGGNRTPFRNRGMNAASNPPKVAFDADYDFEKANEELLTQLAKAKLEDGNGETKTEPDTETKEDTESRNFYSKDDFFDNISCEALERSKGNVPRVDWKAERKLNAETFGLPPSPGGPRQGRQRGGPRMPRGGNFGMPMMHMGRGPAGGFWMIPNNYYRSGPRRPRMRNNQNNN